MSQALYRKYRSKSLADVVGQNHITDILTRAIRSGRIAHAYLLTGPRGVGKTSVARILAHEINQLPYTEESTHLDIIEIDAASNNGVEDVRDLREKVQIAPVSAAKKVYIIDEVHMLSKPAFNALLKTLEEPPAHVVFILATTDADKLPATIISRTQRYGFRAINADDAVKHLKSIAKEEKISITDEAFQLIAERGDGSFRDSISLLDQLASLADETQGITAELVEISLGLAPTSLVSQLLEAVDAHAIPEIVKLLDDSIAQGVSPVQLTDQLIRALRIQAITKHQALHLLDSLLDVAKSSHPSIKLLSVLGTAALEHKPKTVALATPVLEVTASVESLSQQATRKKPSIEAVKPVAIEPAVTVEKAAPRKAAKNSDFDWKALIEHTRENYVALYSVLSKCEYELDGSDLTLYTGNAFYKKKLDDPKYSAHLYQSLENIGGYQLTIHTVPTGGPMKSSQAASVAAIMGGGKEVLPEAA